MNEPLVLFSMLPGVLIHSLWILAILAIVASMFLKKVPFINKYWIPLRVSGMTLLLLMTYIEGAYNINNKWIEKSKELQEKIAEAEAKVVKENIVIQEKIVEKTKVIKQKGDTVVQYVDRIVKGDTQVIENNMSDEERKKFQEQVVVLQNNLKNCPLPQIIVDMHNNAINIGKGEKK